MRKIIFIIMFVIVVSVAAAGIVLVPHASAFSTKPPPPPPPKCTYSMAVSYSTSTAGLTGTPWSVTSTCTFSVVSGCSLPTSTIKLTVSAASSSLATFSVSPTSSTSSKPTFTTTITPSRVGTSTLVFACSNAYAIGGNGVGSSAITVTAPLQPITSCALGIATTAVAVGTPVTWNVTSTPANVKAYLNGTKNGVTDVNEVLSGFTNESVPAIYSCADMGTYTRSVHVVGLTAGQGSCTTNTVTFTVTDPNHLCSPLPPVCTYVTGTASSCTTPSVPSSQVVSLINPTATTTSVSFKVNVSLPAAATSSGIWNTAYYWSQSNNSWIQFFLKGTPYVSAAACSNPKFGTQPCWLKGDASTTITVQTSAAKGDAIYVLTYDKVWSNGGWQGPSCAGGTSTSTCWRLSVYPPNTAALMARILRLTTVEDVISTAQNAGYLVQSSFLPGESSVLISQPLTHKMLASVSETDN